VAYRIEYSPEAEEHLRVLTRRQQAIVLDVVEKAALVHVPIVHDLVDIAHRRQRNATLPGDREDRHLVERPRPALDERIGREHQLRVARHVQERGVITDTEHDIIAYRTDLAKITLDQLRFRDAQCSSLRHSRAARSSTPLMYL